MKIFLSGLVVTLLMVACNNGETKVAETAVKPVDTVSATKPATDTVPSTLTTLVIAETPEAMGAELCRLNKAIKTAKAIGDQAMADISQKKYNEYNKVLKEKFSNDDAAKRTIKEIMEQCDKN